MSNTMGQSKMGTREVEIQCTLLDDKEHSDNRSDEEQRDTLIEYLPESEGEEIGAETEIKEEQDELSECVQPFTPAQNENAISTKNRPPSRSSSETAEQSSSNAGHDEKIAGSTGARGNNQSEELGAPTSGSALTLSEYDYNLGRIETTTIQARAASQSEERAKEVKQPAVEANPLMMSGLDLDTQRAADGGSAMPRKDPTLEFFQMCFFSFQVKNKGSPEVLELNYR